MGKLQLELFTRPTCSCQEGKKFLAKNDISYTNYDLSKEPEKEQDLLALTGTRIVPAFVFKDQSFLSKFKKPKVFIGFENNLPEIKQLLQINE